MTETNDLIIQAPDGHIVDLKSIRSVTTLKNTNDYVFFYLLYNGLTIDESKCIFRYDYKNYSDEKDALHNKVENIRREIVKRMNGGNPVKEINAGINLKKA